MSSQSNQTPMLAEIRDQSGVLARVISHCSDGIRDLGARHAGKRLHLVGCGDMHFAGQQVAALAESLWDVCPRAWPSMDARWRHHRLTAEDFVICASVSGRTPRTLEAALLARQAGAAVLGITDNPQSPLHEALDETLILGTTPPDLLLKDAYAGYRNVIAQTQTFTAVLLAELLLASSVHETSTDFSWIPARVGQLVGALDDTVAELAEPFFVGGEQIVVLGSGPHWPAARYGAAKMLEFAVPATAQCIEEFNHQEAFVADSRTRVILLAADEPAESRASELTGAWESLGVRTLVLAKSGDFPGEQTRQLVLPCTDLIDAVLSEVVALQLLAARGVAAMGRDPHRWLGGRRAELIQSMSQQTIRGSRSIV